MGGGAREGIWGGEGGGSTTSRSVALLDHTGLPRGDGSVKGRGYSDTTHQGVIRLLLRRTKVAKRVRHVGGGTPEL